MNLLRRLWASWESPRVLGVVMVLLTLASGVSLYIQTERTNRVAECVAAYQTGFSRALQARTESQTEFNSSLNELIVTVADSSTSVQVREALTKYVDSAAKRDADLRANPYPEPTFCSN